MVKENRSMAPSTKDLRYSIAEILRDADLSVTTTKKVRLQLEEKFNTELLDRRKEIDDIAMKMLMDKEKFKNVGDSKDSKGRVSSKKAAKFQKRLTEKIMALSKAVLSSSIADILKDADLDTITAKEVRLDLEKKFRTDLLSRKQEISDIVLEMLTANANKTDDSEEGSEDSETEAPPPKKAKSNARGSQKKAKKAKEASSDEEDEPEDEDDEDSSEKAGDEALARKIQKEELQSRTRAAKKSSKPAKGAKPAAKAPKKASGGGGGGGGKKNNSGFTREYNLSDELAAVVGARAMARHAVVKKIWEVVKEKNLYDPTDKRFAICNDELMSVFRIKRFRTFSMMKYLSKHFLEPS